MIDNWNSVISNNDTVYIEGFPLAIARVEGVHIKNRYSSIKPKSSTNEKTVITITDYEIYIKSFGHEAGACYSPNSLYPQWNGIDKQGHLQGKSIHYNWSSTFDTYKSRIYIGNYLFQHNHNLVYTLFLACIKMHLFA